MSQSSRPQNKYENLKREAIDLPDTKPDTRKISFDKSEQIYLHVSEPYPGIFAAGYSVYWKNGRLSQRVPSAKDGTFSSHREAELYTVGFFLMYIQHFTQHNREAILSEEKLLAQTQLF